MPRRIVPFIPGEYYHLYNRGNNRQNIFFERENYFFFLRGIKKYLQKHVLIIAYCLMPTHYHILIQVKPETFDSTSPSKIPKPSISTDMMSFIVSYTRAVNIRYNRVGSLFQGQIKGKLITNNQYLLNLCVYIHANPVKDGLVESPETWEFSNYREWVNLRAGTLVDHNFIKENFSNPQEYTSLVMDYIKSRSLPEGIKNQLTEFD